ncbi:MAG: transketolase [Sphingomonadaceae bacterium]|nr:transketolase [Sphingomonadaceae bacterium]
MATAPAAHALQPDHLTALELIERRLLWLSAWTIHHANHLRESRDGLKVGGHQASCASMTSVMAALYFHALRPGDRVAVKPHAGPLLHAIHYLLGNQSREQLERFRALGGAQSYPSRTKDRIPVDFSTGSVGLGVAITAFASLVQDYLIAHGQLDERQAGRMIALLGDAELDEGNIYECLIEGYKHGLRNCWWIVDYNRQSLDATTADRMFERFDGIFEACGWRVLTAKYGAKLRAAFAGPGGGALRAFIDGLSNSRYAALTFQGGAAWRAAFREAAGTEADRALAGLDDAGVAELMTDLGGHCLETLCAAYDEAASADTPALIIAYTVKGRGLPFAGHKDNHSGLMTPTQIAALAAEHGVRAGEEWEPFAGLGGNARALVEGALTRVRPMLALASADARGPLPLAPAEAGAPQPLERVGVPPIPAPTGAEQSTQQAFGRILLWLAKSGHPLADRIVTTSPDVTVSTNLGGWVNQRGLFRRRAERDVFAAEHIPSAQKWAFRPAGQHFELGIAEHNLFLTLAAFGLSGALFGHRLLPIGTVYDPFIARGLDALNYACYQGARFLLVATPSGVTLGPEGGAHQSISTPLIGMGQPGLSYFEPAYADELAAAIEWAFGHMQDEADGSVYLRLTTRTIAQPERADELWRADFLRGGYWLRPPARGAEAAIVATGALMPEAIAAWEALAPDLPGLGLLAAASPDLMERGWRADGSVSHAARLLAPLAPDACLVTVIDGSPAALSWLGAVRGQRVAALGTERFGETGDLPDQFRLHRLDANAIIEATANLLA